MRKEKIRSLIGLFIFICIIFAAMGMFYRIFKEKRQYLDESNVKSSMLLIQGACKVIYEDSIMKNDTEKLIGTKISEMENNDEIDKSIIEEFKEKKLIEETDYEKYFILTDDNLEALGMYFKNEKESYYIIGYEKDDVIITKGFNGKYRLSEINLAEQDTNAENAGSDSEDNTEEENEDKEASEDSDESTSEEKSDESTSEEDSEK